MKNKNIVERDEDIANRDFSKLMFLISEMLQLNFPEGVSFASFSGALVAWIYRWGKTHELTAEQISFYLKTFAERMEKGDFFDS